MKHIKTIKQSKHKKTAYKNQAAKNVQILANQHAKLLAQ